MVIFDKQLFDDLVEKHQLNYYTKKLFTKPAKEHDRGQLEILVDDQECIYVFDCGYHIYCILFECPCPNTYTDSSKYLQISRYLKASRWKPARIWVRK